MKAVIMSSGSRIKGKRLFGERDKTEFERRENWSDFLRGAGRKGRKGRNNRGQRSERIEREDTAHRKVPKRKMSRWFKGE